MSKLPPPLQLIPADAPFDLAQREWLNGFFNALLTQPRAAAAETVPAVSGKTISLLFASQTGTAESWAKKFAKRLKTQGMAARALELQSVKPADLAQESVVLVLASTYGEGDPPDSCAGFMGELADADGPILAGLQFSVLALGDRNYLKFCAFGHAIDTHFERLGGARILPVHEVDSAAAADFASWQDDLLLALPAIAGSSPARAASGAEATELDEQEDSDVPGMSREHAFGATLLSNRRLNHPDSDKETRHIVLSLSGAQWQYQPGDALGVWPRNPAAAVHRLIEGVGLAAHAVVMYQRRALSLFETITAHCEILRMTTVVALRFSRQFNDLQLEALLQSDDNQAVAEFLHGLDALALVKHFHNASFTAQSLVDLLPPLAPRLYSISSSMAAHPGEVHLTVAQARYQVDHESRAGLASAFLSDAERLFNTVPVYLHRNNRFRLPADPNLPIIMIGPGTGIAPFRSFLEERHALQQRGQTWLFFGDRKAGLDFLYQDELEAWLADGTLTRLDTAFSRDAGEKVYVQQRLHERSAEIWQWLEQGAAIYVCGDALRMAKDVDLALQQILVREGHMSEAKAQLELRHWGANARYLRDVY